MTEPTTYRWRPDDDWDRHLCTAVGECDKPARAVLVNDRESSNWDGSALCQEHAEKNGLSWEDRQ